MTHKTFSFVVGIIFLIIAVSHLARAIWSVPVTFGNVSIPVSASWAVFLVAAYLSWQGIKLGKRE